jgi:predicted RND superfamily exporter protein
MLAAGATAALGFASLAVLGVPGMADLGFSAAYGIGSAMVLELSFMPALRARMRPRGGRAHGAFGERGLRLLGDWLLSRRGPAVILGAAALVIVVAAAGVPRIRPGGSTREYLPAGHAVTHDLEAIRSHFPGTVSMTILFDGPPGAATAPETLAGIARLARALRTDPNVARTASLVDLVEELHAVFGPEGTWTLPADRALLAQLLFLGRGPAFERFVDRGDRRTVLWAYLRSDEPVEVERVLALARREAAALELPAGMTVQVAGGVGPMLVALEATVTRGKVLNIAALLGVIYVLSSLVLRSPVAGVFVVLPLVLAVAVSFGVVAWTGIRFDVVSASVLAIGVGIGADYAIYCLYRLREELRRGLPLAAALRRMLDTSGRATLFVAVSIALGFTVFAPSAYLAFRLSGLLTPVGMLASCLAALSVMPAALLVVRPAFLFGRRPACPAPAAAPEAVQRSA